MDFVIPENAVTHFHLREGDVIGDLGAGSGFFEKALSRAVGTSGRVFAFEIQRPLVERLSEMVRREHLGNVEVLWCDIESPEGCKLREGMLDAGLFSNTLFQVEDKARALEEAHRLIRSGGKLLVIDWTQSFAGMGPQPSDVLTESDAQALIEQYGFAYERSFPAGEYHYGLAFRRV